MRNAEFVNPAESKMADETPPVSSATSSCASAATASCAPAATACASAAASQLAPFELSPQTPSRARWRSSLEFTFACISYAVGLGNFWRFPYLCYVHGGGAFLLPYTIVLLLIGLPLFLLELCVGQRHQISAVPLWHRIHPALGGIGVAGTLANFFVALYYNAIVAWALRYLFASFASPLPWDESLFGARDYFEIETLRCRAAALTRNASVLAPNASANASMLAEQMGSASTPSVEPSVDPPLAPPPSSCSWDGISEWPQTPGLLNPGGLVPTLIPCLLMGWVLVWLCVRSGVESLGKAVYLTATLPYVVLLILLCRGLSLAGASDGLAYYLTPRFELMGEPTVWVAAASQIFYSTGVGWSTLVAFASYNAPNHNFVRDAWLVPLINCATSFVAGLVVFSVLGNLSHETNVPVSELSLEGSGLAFVAYPRAIARMPGAPLFAIAFFGMVVCLGVDSQFAMVETCLTALDDGGFLPRSSKPRRATLLCTLMFLIGLIFITEGGLHWLELFDTFACSITLFLCGMLEAIAVGWVYGAEPFAADCLAMSGWRAPKPLLWAYKYFIPTALAALALTSLGASISEDYPFPPEGLAIGWALSLCSMIPLGYFAVRYLLDGRCVRADQKPVIRELVVASAQDLGLGLRQGACAQGECGQGGCGHGGSGQGGGGQGAGVEKVGGTNIQIGQQRCAQPGAAAAVLVAAPEKAATVAGGSVGAGGSVELCTGSRV